MELKKALPYPRYWQDLIYKSRISPVGALIYLLSFLRFILYQNKWGDNWESQDFPGIPLLLPTPFFPRNPRKKLGNPGGALDQILFGDVPSRLQEHTRSLHQFFEKVYPFLIPIFRKSISNHVFHTKILKIGTVPYTKIMKIDTVLYTNI